MGDVTRQRGGARAVCAAVALLTLAAAPGASAARPPQPRPYALSDEAAEVRGTAEETDAPALRPGLAADRIRPGEEKFYAVTLDAASSAHLAVTAVPEPGSRPAPTDGVQAELRTVSGLLCDMDQASAAGQAAYPLTVATSRIVGPGTTRQCRAEGRYLLHVTRREGGARSDAWPVEVSYLKEPPVRGRVPAPRPGAEEQTDQNNARPSPPTGRPRTVHGGAGFDDAEAVRDGVWRDRFVPGETRYYRVPVDWGQRLYADAEVPGAARKDGSPPPLVAAGLRLNVHNPARAPLDREQFRAWTGNGSRADRYSNPVRYENRSMDAASRTHLAGWYYVAVTVTAPMAEPFPGGVPVTLRIDVRGRARKGPAYAGDARAAGIGVTEDDRKAAGTGRTAGQVRADARLRTLGWTGIGVGSALLLGLAGWFLAARRRSAAAPGGRAPR